MPAPPTYAAPTLLSVGSTVQYVSERGADVGTILAAKVVAKNAAFATNGSVDLKVFRGGDNGLFTIQAALYDPAGTVLGTWRLLP